MEGLPRSSGTPAMRFAQRSTGRCGEPRIAARVNRCKPWEPATTLGRISGATLSDARRLHAIIKDVLRVAKVAGAEDAEVHVDEVLDDLTRFANNAIHQNVSENGVTVSIRTVAEGRTARVTTNRLDENSLRAAVDS